MDNHTKAVMFSSENTEYGTPAWVYEPVIKQLGLDWDMAASHENHLLPHYATAEGLWVKNFSTPSRVKGSFDGLADSWQDKRVWCNPPYGRFITGKWVKRAAISTQYYAGEHLCPMAVLLLPARTDTDWFQRWVAPYAEVHFLQGRIHFVGAKWVAPFPSILAVYYPEHRTVQGKLDGYLCDLKSSGEFTGGPNV